MPPNSTESSQAAKKHILSVDDELDIRELLQEILTMKGYRVSAVATVKEALKILHDDPPHLIISDFQLVDSDGFLLIEEVRKNRPDLPILLLTGVSFDSEVVRNTILKKVSGYLDKTASLSTILKEVDRLLGDSPPGMAARS